MKGMCEAHVMPIEIYENFGRGATSYRTETGSNMLLAGKNGDDFFAGYDYDFKIEALPDPCGSMDIQFFSLYVTQKDEEYVWAKENSLKDVT